MISVLFFIDTLTGGGAEKVLRTLVNNMDQARFEITVMTLWPEDKDKLLVPGIRYRSVYSEDNRINRVRCRLESQLGLTYRLHMRGAYDIEIAYLECAPTKIMAASSNKKALKLAWVHCDLIKKSEDPKAFARKCAPWYAKFDKVICVSENVRSSFAELFGQSPETAVLYNVNDETEILRKAWTGETPEKRRLTVVTAGRLCAQKGYDRLLRAHKKLLKEGYAYDLWILGEGPERPSMEAYIRENELSDSVRLLGFCENPYPYFQAADMLVCSSRYEGFSTFVTEGLILGKAVVTTDCTGMRELLGDSEYGLIVPNSEAGIYEGLKRLLDDPELRGCYATRAEIKGRSLRKEEMVRSTERFFEEELRKKQSG